MEISLSTWKRLSRAAKFVKYHINRKLGRKLQDFVYDLYDYVYTE